MKDSFNDDDNKVIDLQDLEDEEEKQPDPNKSEAYVDFISQKPKKRRMSGSLIQSNENMNKDAQLDYQMMKTSHQKDAEDI